MGFTLFRCASSSAVDSLPGEDEVLGKLRCAACSLRNVGAIHRKMPPSGTEEPIIYIVGEAPGREEDEAGEPFVGPSGAMIKWAVAKQLCAVSGLDFREVSGNVDKFVKEFCRISNTVWTRPPNNRTPTEAEIACCRPHLEHDLINNRPNVVLAVGTTPARWFGINKPMKSVRGRPIVCNVRGHEFLVIPIYHPSYLMRNGITLSSLKRGDDDLGIVFMRDIRRMAELAVNPVDIRIPRGVKYFLENDDLPGRFIKATSDKDFRKVEKALYELEKEPYVAFDIETASLEKEDFRKMRPYGNGSSIVSISFSNGNDLHLSILLDHDGAGWSEWKRKVLIEKLKKFLSHNGSGPRFIAHNLIFELEWLWHFWRVSTIPSSKWEDTMGQAFVIDPRPGALDLDFLCQIYFGLNIKKFVPVNISNVKMEDDQRLLYYNTLDAFFTYHLFERQQEFIKEQNLEKVYRDQVERVAPLMKMQAAGLIVDQEKNKEINKRIKQEISEIMSNICEDDGVKEYESRYGKFHPGSNQHVAKLMYEICGAPLATTRKGNPKVDSDTLEALDIPVAKLIVEYRHLMKLQSTYVAELAVGGKYLWPDGKLHANFHHAKVQTRRFSSSDPNCQNFPKRKDAYIRSQIVAPHNHFVVSVDYGQIEARVIAMITRDRKMVRYMWESYDIHAYWARRMAEIYPNALEIASREVPGKEAMDGLRFLMKNRFVFPSFYGAGVPSMSRALGVPENIVRTLYEEFRDEFPAVIKWQERVRNIYKRHGYLELMTGFRRYAPVEKANAVINSPIQGTAAEIVTASLVALSERAESTGDWNFQPVIDIHDDLTFYIPKSNAEYYIDEIIRMMCSAPIEKFSWINVPLIVEVSIGDDWYNQEKIAEVSSQSFGHVRTAA